MSPRKVLSRKRIRYLTFGFAGLAALVLLAGLSLPTLVQQATPAPTSSIDPVFLTATANLSVGTMTAQVALPATATPVSTLDFMGLDPVFLTATAIIAEATVIKRADLALTATPTEATLTASEQEKLRLQWKTELEQATGFTHPIFDYITYAPIADHVTLNYADISQQIPVNRTRYEGTEYVGFIAGREFHDAFFLFKVVDHEPMLLYNWLPEPTKLTKLGLGGFADRNGNGKADLAVFKMIYEGCGENGIFLLELQSDGTMIDIPLPPAHGVGFAEDLDGDELPEIVVSNVVPIPGTPAYSCGSYVTHFYKWNGTAYEEHIFAIIDEEYFSEINTYWQSIKEQTGCLLPDRAMYEMLLGYLSLHQLDKGWARLASELHWEQCSPQTLREQGEAMGQLLQWVGTNLETSNSAP